MADAVASGTATIAGFAHEAPTQTGWPSAVAAQVRARLPLLSAEIDPGVTQTAVVTRAQTLGASGLDLLTRTPSVRVSLRLRYEGAEAFLASALGYMPASRPTALGSGVYEHLYELSADLASEAWPASDAQPPTVKLHRRGTFAAWRQVSVWELVSGMVQSLTLGSDGTLVTLDVTLLAATLQQPSTVNTVPVLQALPPLTAPLVSIHHGVCLIGPASPTTALGPANAVCSRSLAVTLENNLAPTFGPRTALAPEEYTRTALPTLTLTFELPRYDSDLWLSRWGSQALLMGDLRWTGPAIGSSGQQYQVRWSFPALRLTDVRPSAIAVGLASVQHTLQAEVPTQAAAGLPTLTQPGPVGVTLVNRVAQHPLL